MERFQHRVRSLTGADLGEPVNAATVDVFDTGTLDRPTIYDDDLATPTTKTNPFTTDSEGLFHVYAPNGRYDVRLSGGTPAIASAYTLADISLGLGDAGVPGFAFAALPTSGNAAHAGRLARVTDLARGFYMDTGVRWFSVNERRAHVHEFGAVGDGVTDDTVAINAAIASGANVIIFEDLTYQITSALSPLAGQRWIGQGFTGGTLIRQGTANANAIFAQDGNGGWTMENIRIQGGSGTGSGIRLRSDISTITNVVLRGVIVVSSGQDGIRLEGAAKIHCYDVECTNNGRDGFRMTSGGVGFGSTDNCYFYGCFAGANTGQGFFVGIVAGSEAQNCHFFGCSAESNTDRGWNVLGSPNSFYGCHSEGNTSHEWEFASTGNNDGFRCRAEGGNVEIGSQVNLFGWTAATYNVLAGVGNAMLLGCNGVITDNNGGTVQLIGGPVVPVSLGPAQTVRWGGATNTRIVKVTQNTQGVAGVATTIATATSDYGSFLLVAGRITAGGTAFLDLVVASQNTAPVVVQSFSTQGAPAARTYTRLVAALQLSLAAGTYDITTARTMMPSPD